MGLVMELQQFFSNHPFKQCCYSFLSTCWLLNKMFLKENCISPEVCFLMIFILVYRICASSCLTLPSLQLCRVLQTIRQIGDDSSFSDISPMERWGLRLSTPLYKMSLGLLWPIECGRSDPTCLQVWAVKLAAATSYLTEHTKISLPKESLIHGRSRSMNPQDRYAMNGPSHMKRPWKTRHHAEREGGQGAPATGHTDDKTT